MHMLGGSTFFISQMATAAALPLFLFTLPAGAFADMLDQKSLLIGTNLWLAASAGIFAVFAFLHWLNPYLILTFIFLFGLGFALSAPVFSAVVPAIVSKEELASAVTLGGLQMNISGIIGPALAGILLPFCGPYWIFVLNGGFFFLVIAAVSRWQQPYCRLPLENFFESFVAALRYIRYAPGMQIVLVRNVLFSIFIALIPSLMPVVALKDAHLGSGGLGLLFTSMGIGSVCSAVLVIPRARARFTPNQLTIIANSFLIVVFCMLAFVRSPELLMIVAGLAGASWTMAAAEIWVAGQRAMPDWARGRMNAAHIMIAQGALAGGGLIWGIAASAFGTRWTLLSGAVLLLVTLFLAIPFSLDIISNLNLDPAPLVLPWKHTSQSPRVGLITLTVDFEIRHEDRDRFLLLMKELRLAHLRNGAFYWRLDEDLSTRNEYRLEMLFGSWSEYLLSLERMTKDERVIHESVRSLHAGTQEPKVKRFLSVDQEVLNQRPELVRAEPSSL